MKYKAGTYWESKAFPGVILYLSQVGGGWQHLTIINNKINNKDWYHTEPMINRKDYDYIDRFLKPVCHLRLKELECK